MTVNPLRLLYPCDPFDITLPDQEYGEEFDAMRARGMTCSLFSLEDFLSGTFRARPALGAADDVIYRGWMLAPGEYAKLTVAIMAAGATPLVTPAAYQRCHHLPGWYDLCRAWTPETVFLERNSNFEAALAGLHWPAYFVKDHVKSLTTARGSVASNAAEVEEIVGLLEHYRGAIEGGVCVRRFEHLLPDTEERYFVFRGTAHAYQGPVPDLVDQVAAIIDSPFFSVDIVLSADGAPRMIELGDGQVSDRKKWPAALFAALFDGVAYSIGHSANCARPAT